MEPKTHNSNSEKISQRKLFESPMLRELKTPLFIVVVIIVLAIFVGVKQPSFWGWSNIQNILFSAGFTGLAACGMTLLIGAGLLDLSVSGVMAVSAITVAYTLPHTSVAGAITVALLVGLLAGVLNGVVVAVLRIPPFIGTLGTMYLLLGVAFILTNGKVLAISSSYFYSYTTASLGGFPVPFLAFLLLAALTYFILRWTQFGRHVRALGSNPRATYLAGISTRRTQMLIFIFAAFSFALAGVLMAGRLSSAEGNMAIGIEMNVIAAVVVGGTPLRGGRASVLGTLAGATLFSVLNNGLNMLNVASYYQYVITGIILIAAIAINQVRSNDTEIRGEG